MGKKKEGDLKALKTLFNSLFKGGVLAWEKATAPSENQKYQDCENFCLALFPEHKATHK